jgi:putative hydrolase of HD superfamily
MKTKTENPPLMIMDEGFPPLLRFYFELNQLKELYRQGWLKRGIAERDCETVAEHVYATALLTMILGPVISPDLDICRALQLALVHDLGEIYAGDLTPADGVSLDEKSQMECQAVQRLVSDLPGGEVVLQLWQEYEAGESLEARFVHQIDRLEMGLQAGVYSLKGASGMEEFLAAASEALKDKPLISLMSELKRTVSPEGDLIQ